MSKRTVKLSQAGEGALSGFAQALGTGSEEEALTLLIEAVLTHVELNPPDDLPAVFVLGTSPDRRVRVRLRAQSEEAVSSTQDVMGGDACVRHTRIPVWMLVEYKRQGMTDSELLVQFPGPNAADLAACWDYYATHAPEVDAQKKRHEAA